MVDVLAGRMPGLPKPDAVVCVIDATQLLRNLFLASQVAELGLPMVIVLNQCDAAQRKGIRIDSRLLSERLGVPVVRAVASRQEGTDEILEALQSVIDKPRRMAAIEWPEAIVEATGTLKEALPAEVRKDIHPAEIRRILFDANSALLEHVHWTRDGSKPVREQARDRVRAAGYNPMAAEALLQYEHLNRLIEGVVTHPSELKPGRSESIDKLMVHRGWGLVIFGAIMYLIFLSVYTWAEPFMGVIESGKGRLQDLIAPWLANLPILRSLIGDGVIEGVGAVLVFLPQILILFFFIGLLEDSGYMARAAFLMDKMFSWCGLNGKSFVPLLSSYACAVPGILATRTIEDPKARLTTILIAPFMSCSARLPVYVLMIGAFVQPVYGAWWASVTLFAMHLVGLVIAIPTAFVMNRMILKIRSHPFVLEMPSYRVPRLRDVFYRMLQSATEFLKKAGTLIFAITLIVWALLYFPRPESVGNAARETFLTRRAAAGAAATPESIAAKLENGDPELAGQLAHAIGGAYIEQSFLGRAGKAIQPVFDPAGFDWKITVGVLASFPAREVVVSTLGVIHSLGGDVGAEDRSLRNALARSRWPEGTKRAGRPVYILPVVVGIMIFFALCSQCGATLAVIAREAGLRWAIFSFFYMTALAWLGAVACYQIGTRLIGAG